jgi:DNA-directed RNA polymerase specialized sigma24 family protein
VAKERRSKSPAPSAPPVSPEVRALERIGRLLAVIATKGLNAKDQIVLLDAAGYSVQEIADIARTTANHVSVALFLARKERESRRTTAKPKKKK